MGANSAGLNRKPFRIPAVTTPERYMSDMQRFTAATEAVEVMLASAPDVSGDSAEVLGAVWDVSAEKLLRHWTQSRPESGRESLSPLAMTTAHQRGVSQPQGFRIGRIVLPIARSRETATNFSDTAHATRLLERMAACVSGIEPCLLVGETGCGKTTLVGHMAAATGHPLTVVNLSLQSDAADLCGSVRPVDPATIGRPLHERLLKLFSREFSLSGGEPPYPQH